MTSPRKLLPDALFLIQLWPCFSLRLPSALPCFILFPNIANEMALKASPSVPPLAPFECKMWQKQFMSEIAKEWIYDFNKLRFSFVLLPAFVSSSFLFFLHSSHAFIAVEWIFCAARLDFIEICILKDARSQVTCSHLGLSRKCEGDEGFHPCLLHSERWNFHIKKRRRWRTMCRASWKCWN